MIVWKRGRRLLRFLRVVVFNEPRANAFPFAACNSCKSAFFASTTSNGIDLPRGATAAVVPFHATEADPMMMVAVSLRS